MAIDAESNVVVVRQSCGKEVRRIALLGNWEDSLGHTISVSHKFPGGPLQALLEYKSNSGELEYKSNSEKKQDEQKEDGQKPFTSAFSPNVNATKKKVITLSRRQQPILNPHTGMPTLDPHTGMPIFNVVWNGGNATLIEESATENKLVWVTPDGRHSIWKRSVEETSSNSDSINSETKQKSGDADSDDILNTDAFPWLLVQPEFSLQKLTAEQKQSIENCPEQKAECLDGGRINCLLDMRQAIGSNRTVQDEFRFLLMDHDMEQEDSKTDYLVPPPTSALYSKRLPAAKAKKCIAIAEKFYRMTEQEKFVQILYLQDTKEIRVGRHIVYVAGHDLHTLRKRWTMTKQLQEAGMADAVREQVELFHYFIVIIIIIFLLLILILLLFFLLLLILLLLLCVVRCKW